MYTVKLENSRTLVAARLLQQKRGVLLVYHSAVWSYKCTILNNAACLIRRGGIRGASAVAVSIDYFLAVLHAEFGDGIVGASAGTISKCTTISCFLAGLESLAGPSPGVSYVFIQSWIVHTMPLTDLVSVVSLFRVAVGYITDKRPPHFPVMQ